ncbi:MAG: DUF2892 domain-containing protein [Planctomycetaceae bacterium]
MRDIQPFESTSCGNPGGYASGEINIGQLERIASVAAGAGILLGLARSGSLTKMVGALLGAALIHRGITGHCQVYEAIDNSSMNEFDDYEEDQEESRQIDIASDDSFPASDPPAWTGAAAT